MKKSDIKYITKWAKKIRAVNLLGGKCERCGESRIYTLDFHHENGEEKEFQISRVGIHKTWSLIELELKKCILLCRNCHIKEHFYENFHGSKRSDIKRQILEYKGTYHCEECNYYDASGLSLDLHHKKDKLFNISQEVGKNSAFKNKRHIDFTDRILEEIDKCMVLCRNCHVTKQIDMNKQRELKQYIEERVGNMKENKQIDRPQIISLRKKGWSLGKISKELGYGKSTVAYVASHFSDIQN